MISRCSMPHSRALLAVISSAVLTTGSLFATACTSAQSGAPDPLRLEPISDAPEEPTLDDAPAPSADAAVADAAVDTGEATTPPPPTIATGSGHTCALVPGGRVKCWGSNVAGALGIGDTEARGDEPNELGLNLPAVALGAARAVSVAIVSNASCAILEGGATRCWGNGVGDSPGEGPVDLAPGKQVRSIGWLARGAPPNGPAACFVFTDGSAECNRAPLPRPAGRSYVQLASTGQAGCVLLDDGVRCWGHTSLVGQGGTAAKTLEEALALPPIDLGGAAPTKVAVGYAHACALLPKGAVKCWGRCSVGTDCLGIGPKDNNPRGDAPGEMGAALPALNLEGERAIDLAVVSNTFQSCALTDKRRLFCWGETPKPTSMPGAVDAISSGERTGHLCVRGVDGIRCFGVNTSGQLGLGRTSEREPASPSLPTVDLD